MGPGDLAAQVEQSYLNVGAVVAAAGAGFEDVARLTVYVVDWHPDELADLGHGVARAAARLGASPVKPVTRLGVVAPGEPDLLVEVDAVVVLP